MIRNIYGIRANDPGRHAAGSIRTPLIPLNQEGAPMATKRIFINPREDDTLLPQAIAVSVSMLAAAALVIAHLLGQGLLVTV